MTPNEIPDPEHHNPTRRHYGPITFLSQLPALLFYSSIRSFDKLLYFDASLVDVSWDPRSSVADVHDDVDVGKGKATLSCFK